MGKHARLPDELEKSIGKSKFPFFMETNAGRHAIFCGMKAVRHLDVCMSIHQLLTEEVGFWRLWVKRILIPPKPKIKETDYIQIRIEIEGRGHTLFQKIAAAFTDINRGWRIANLDTPFYVTSRDIKNVEYFAGKFSEFIYLDGTLEKAV